MPSFFDGEMRGGYAPVTTFRPISISSFTRCIPNPVKNRPLPYFTFQSVRLKEKAA